MNNKNILTNLTLNWHIEQKCNMHCKYCFTPKFSNLSENENNLILSKLSPYFSRINLVGGEPTLNPYLINLAKRIKDMNCKPSIVTNAFRMVNDSEYSESIINNFDYIGLSVDSLRNITNRNIGRCVKKQTISEKRLIVLCRNIKQSKKYLKINTVVSRINYNEDFHSFYNDAKPDKIKLFQVLKPNIQVKQDYSNMLISKKEFSSFVKRYSYLGEKLFPEDNSKMMNSYYILNSEGCFCDNNTGAISPSLLNTGMTVRKALSYISVDKDKYISRYTA